MKHIIPALLIFLTAIQTASADNLQHINRWYEALRTVDRPAFESLLSNDAKIELKDLGVVQDREEFIEALDYWEDVAGDLFISTAIVSSGDAKIEVDVCYRFPSNSHTNRETFHLAGELIVRQVQEKLRKGC